MVNSQFRVLEKVAKIKKEEEEALGEEKEKKKNK